MKNSIRPHHTARTLLGCALVCFCLLGFIPASAVFATTPGKAAPEAAPSAPVAGEAAHSATPTPAPSAPESEPPDLFAAQDSVKEALKNENFTYNPRNLIDPFVPFIEPAEAPQPQLSMVEDEESGLPPEPQKPLTPLQKMSLSEVQRGLKAITWGELGRRALIEDAAGKGFIVSVGTPVGERNGVITEIFNDRLIIQQEVWDKQAKRYMPENAVVKLQKEQEK